MSWGGDVPDSHFARGGLLPYDDQGHDIWEGDGGLWWLGVEGSTYGPFASAEHASAFWSGGDSDLVYDADAHSGLDDDDSRHPHFETEDDFEIARLSLDVPELPL